MSSNSSSEDVLLAKIGQNGDFDFLISIGNEHDNHPTDVAPAPDGGAYLLMEYSDEITVGGTTLEASEYNCNGCYGDNSPNVNVLLTRINANGSIAWATQFGNHEADSAWSMDVDSDFNPTILASKWGRVTCTGANPCDNVFYKFWDADGTYTTGSEAKGGSHR